MKKFMGKNFLLSTDTAKTLYHDYAAKMPIIDYHCHINPKEIAENRTFENITQVWLGGDHYKWRQMRSNGVDEKYITGDAPDREKFQKWAETLQKAIGNPLYHWSHLELQRYFGYYGTLNADTAEEVWNLCNEKLKTSALSVRSIIKSSNVETICTTDDPIDSLEWHSKIKEDTSFDVKVLPAFRPDKAMNIEKPDYLEYLDKLSGVSGITINSFSSLCQALNNRIAFFDSKDCKVSDHALEYVMYQSATTEEIEAIFAKRTSGASLSEQELLQFKTAFMVYVGKKYHEYGWVMQLHYGTKRDNNTLMFNKLGADTGYDCINTYSSSAQMANFLNALNTTDQLPKTIIYSLNPNDNAAIGTVLGCFQDSSVAGKVQQGSAWWFNDHKVGMTDQMTSLANLGLLANFVGMLTDSRSFLSYTRHEYFRRILCDLIGNWVENGEYPDDIAFLGNLVQDISYNNTKKYFKF
ncbi:uronate isomerase [Anaerocolumna cellulosilytica]|uniref:Uronate isomerase n=1 Tax=Anaerocolumna cellulosilytica TaxID=433286 RepID=A0A6S6R795_9FIRM|nr:glucuronate isomerase [Anaerocolumna cellulosilytica]MBB5197610.1 glucuronate isomerase [Anaerocolumna cellulosilytica]BCJ95135.1 uronate isomerase [Anaerocolumna cellulosilytica]